jgi:type I restriction enzyme S subunit
MEKKLPKNWVETELDSLFSLAYGKGLRVSELIEEGEYSVYGANGIIGKYNKFNQEESKVIISCRGAASGVMHKTKPKAFVTSNSIVLDAFSDELLLPNYVKYFLTSADKTEVITGTAQPQITIQLLKNLNFYLPPLKEQQRIVEKLDTLFTHLEVLNTRLETIPTLLKNFKHAVLTQAVTGKLTEEWRVGKELDKWEQCNLNDLCLSITDGDHQAPPRVENGVPFLVISNVSKGYFDFKSVSRFVPRDYFDSLKYTRVPKKGDVLYTVTGSYGIPLLVNFDKEFCFQRHIAILKTDKSKLNSLYLNYALSSLLLQNQAHKVATGTAQKTVPLRGIKGFELLLPSLLEQTEIVKRVENLFSKADKIKKQYKILKAKIDSLPQAILAKAFKGELVEQLPTDGDAKVLLEEIRELKASLLGAKKTVKSIKETKEVLGRVAEGKSKYKKR